MRVALLMHPWQLSFRGKWTWDDVWNDPRGLSGSEMGFVAIGRELTALGHEVWLISDHGEQGTTCFDNTGCFPVQWGIWNDPTMPIDVVDLAIAINHPEGLERFDCPRVLLHWINSFEFLSRNQVNAVNLWLSPSVSHQEMILGQTHALNDGEIRFVRGEWDHVELGVYPERYGQFEKVPGRCLWSSSPDRGLHHLLYCWPRIKHQVPDATLHIHYRLQAWIEELLAVPEPFPDIEENRQRALYIQDALRRLSDPRWGITVKDRTSRVGIERAQDEAVCFPYPVDTMRYSEGFSCSTLEACAAASGPVVWDTDAIGSVYQGAAEIVPRGDLDGFTDRVVRMLTDEEFRNGVNDRCKKFASERTWRHTTERILEQSELLLKRSDRDAKEKFFEGSGMSAD